VGYGRAMAVGNHTGQKRKAGTKNRRPEKLGETQTILRQKRKATALGDAKPRFQRCSNTEWEERQTEWSSLTSEAMGGNRRVVDVDYSCERGKRTEKMLSQEGKERNERRLEK